MICLHQPSLISKQGTMERDAFCLGEGERIKSGPHGLETQFQAHHRKTHCRAEAPDPYLPANVLNQGNWELCALSRWLTASITLSPDLVRRRGSNTTITG
jgi:hypothetical protein